MHVRTNSLIRRWARSRARLVLADTTSTSAKAERIRHACQAMEVPVDVVAVHFPLTDPTTMAVQDEAAARRLAVDAFMQATKAHPEDAGRIVAACWLELPAAGGTCRASVAFQTLLGTSSGQVCPSFLSQVENDQFEALIAFTLGESLLAIGENAVDLSPRGVVAEMNRAVAPQSWQALMVGDSQKVFLHQDSDLYADDTPLLVFPGSFNPLHAGHRRIEQFAAQFCGRPVSWELSVANVDKPLLDYMEIRNRVKQFSLDDRVWLTRAATFAEKASLFPGATFLVGVDTIIRMADIRYYGGDDELRQHAIMRVAEQDCRFLIFGRRVDEQFRTLSDLWLPDGLLDLCQEVPESHFREDISSSQLRDHWRSIGS